MKKSLFLALLTAVSLTTFDAAARPRPPVIAPPVRPPMFSERDLPPRARDFLRSMFPRERVQFISRTRFGQDVTLTNGTMVQFNLRGDWTRVSAGRRSSVPARILPVRAQDTLNRNFRRADILDVTRSGGGFLVRMSGVRNELRFNARGDLLRR